MILSAAYYHINMKEKASIFSSSQLLDSQPTAPRLNQDLILARDKPSRQFILQPDSEFSPQIAWLMSFPNSGTSFTMTMVSRASNKSFATNYGEEVTGKDDEESLTIYPRRPEGPYWAGMSGKIATPRELPDKFVLTKTHCGSRCLNCGPDEYVEDDTTFLKRCASGHARISPKRRRIDVEYPPTRVGKAIHLIRNPMHNIIARYHLEHRHHGYKNDTKWLKKHSNDANGFQDYCEDMDNEYQKQDEKYFKGQIPNAPCHGEFYKFTQWHNLVHDSLRLVPIEVPVLVVYYEEYSNFFNETVSTILDFLELEHVGVLREFTARSDYDHYFSKDQLIEIRKMVRRTAHDETWELLKHYFEGIEGPQ
jgi:hypothetical protein